MIRKQSHDGSLATVSTICFRIIMAMLFYVPFGEFVHLHMHKFIDFHESSIYIRKCLPKESADAPDKTSRRTICRISRVFRYRTRQE